MGEANRQSFNLAATARNGWYPFKGGLNAAWLRSTTNRCSGKGYQYEWFVPVFLERYLLPILAALTVGVIATIPMHLDWTQRIVGGLALALAAYFFAYTVHKHSSTRKAEVAAKISKDEATFTERIFVPEDVDLDYLTNLYRANTSIQANALFTPYRGKWMRASGSVGNVSDEAGGTLIVTLHVPRKVPARGNERSPLIFLFFENRWRERLSLFRMGSNLSVIGQLKSIDYDGPTLEHCEIVR